jgi:hypothetical protein
MFVPMQIGGGPDLPTRAYQVLRAAVGEGGTAATEDGIDALWRWTRAIGFAMGLASFERAIANFSPVSATDKLTAFERALRIIVPPGRDEQTRREAVQALFPAQARNDPRSLVDQIESIDSRLSIQLADDSVEWISDDGRCFGPTTAVGEGYFGMTGASDTAYYTSRCVLRVLFDVGHTGPLLSDESRIAGLVRTRLRRVLPSWWDFVIITSIGFIAGVSPVGLTGVED